MTTEHKILHRLDRGVAGREELTALIGRAANREGLRLLDAGLLKWAKPQYLALTELGVTRLDELDGSQHA